MCINFFSAYSDEDQNIIDDHRMIIKNYFKGWFLIDFTANLPINYLYNDESSGQSLRYNKLVRLLRLPRLYRLIRLLKMSKINMNIKNKT